MSEEEKVCPGCSGELFRRTCPHCRETIYVCGICDSIYSDDDLDDAEKNYGGAC